VKPRIRMAPFFTHRGYTWVCFGVGGAGWGFSPTEAYAAWMRQWLGFTL
jgi:hypothetical protein